MYSINSLKQTFEYNKLSHQKFFLMGGNSFSAKNLANLDKIAISKTAVASTRIRNSNEMLESQGYVKFSKSAHPQLYLSTPQASTDPI